MPSCFILLATPPTGINPGKTRYPSAGAEPRHYTLSATQYPGLLAHLYYNCP